MKFRDHLELSLSNLWKVKLRTVLTTVGVVVGIAALVSMMSFGIGMQKNVTDTFNSLELFNSITVFPPGEGPLGRDLEGDGEPAGGRPARRGLEPGRAGVAAVLDDGALAEIAKLPGVDTVYPDQSFPALVRFNGREEFRLVQILPAKVAASKTVKLRAGRPYASDDADEAIVNASLLRRLDLKDPAAAVGKTIEIASISFDLGRLNPPDLASLFKGGSLPVSRETYTFTIAGVAEGAGFGPSSIWNDLMIPPGTAGRIKKLPFTSIWDIFRLQEGKRGYSALNVRLSSPRDVDAVKAKIKAMGFSTFALADQFAEVRRAFFYLDMILAAIGMIAIFVAALGIVNTMVMSILERTREIGVMKAVGAGDGDVRAVFFFESSIIGFAGGVFGYGLGWVVSRLINRIVNALLARQGVPAIDYFAFPWWLFAGALAFAVAVSLAAGIYPAHRAALVDPVQALRHD
jgi:putative ABC transport system permease protein